MLDGKRRKQAASIALTAVILVSILALAPPAGAVYVDMNRVDGDGNYINGDKTVERPNDILFFASMNIDSDERIPVDHIETTVRMPDGSTKNVTYNVDGSMIDADPWWIEVKRVPTNDQAGYDDGYRSGYDERSGSDHSFGYGFGYSGSGYAQEPTYKYKIRIHSQNRPTGQYVVQTHAVMEDGSTKFSSDTFDFKVKKSTSGGSPGGTDPGGDTDPDDGTDTDDGTSESGSATVTKQDGRVQVDIQNAKKNQTVSVKLPEGNDTDDVGLESLNVSFSEDSDFDMNISQSDDPPAESGVEEPSGGESLGYLDVAHSTSDSSVSEVEFTFTVSKSRLSDRGVDPSDVTLYRHHGGHWTELETSQIGETDSAYRFGATSPGLSVFAIGTGGAGELTVQSADVGSDQIEPGSSVVVTGVVENTGNVEGTFTVELTAGSSVVATQDVTLAPGESTQVSFVQAFDEAGTYDVAVSGTAAGTLSVGETTTTTTTTTMTTTTTTTTTTQPPTDTTTPGGQDGLGFSGIAIAVLVLLVVAGGGLYYYRRNQ